MAAQEVRKSIHDGSYRYCSKVHCNWISGRSLPSREEVLGKETVRSEAGEGRASLEQLYPLEMSKGPSQVVLSYDRSCNLACPSCRTDYYSATKKQQEQLHKFFGEFVKSVVKDAQLIYMDGARRNICEQALARGIEVSESPGLSGVEIQIFDQWPVV